MNYGWLRMQMAIDDWLEENGHPKLSPQAIAHASLSHRDPSKGQYVKYSISDPRVTLRIYDDLTVEEDEEP